jgi:pyruvate carboxylase
MALATKQRHELSVGPTLCPFRYFVNQKSIKAMKVGVPVVPGTAGPVESYTDGNDFIKEYGFPG